MGAAKVINKEQDYSLRIPKFPGVGVGMILACNKGKVGEGFMLNSEDDLLKKCTFDQTIKVSDDMSFYSALAALQKTDKMWVVRPDNKCKFGGGFIKVAGQDVTNVALKDISLGNITGVSDTIFEIDGTLSSFNSLPVFEDDIILVKGSTGNNGTYRIKSIVFDEVKEVIQIEVFSSIPSDIVGGTIVIDSITTPESFNQKFTNDQALLITGKDQGSYNKKLKIKLYTYAKNPDKVKEPGAFMIEVYKTTTGALLETFVCSRNQEARDGFGRNIYVEEIVKSSNYINVIDNVVLPLETVLQEEVNGLTLSGGFDGYALTDSDMINALKLFYNKNKIYITLMIDGGYSTASYHQALIALCEKRMDSVAILGMPFSAQADSDSLNAMLAYRKVTLNANTSYAALYSHHVLVQDTYNNRQVYVSPVGYVAAIISATAANFELWYPPAGFRRGVLNVLGVQKILEDGDLDVLYDAGINPIKFTPGKGITVHGQKTLSTRPSALDRLNVRLLLIAIEPAINAFLQEFEFEINDDFTRKQISGGIDSYMASIKARKGVYNFITVCTEDNNKGEDIDNYTLNVDLFVEPTKSAEQIQFTTIITKTGDSTSVALSLVS